MTYETRLRLRRWQWANIRAAPRRCYVDAALRSCRLDRRRENIGATIVAMTQTAVDQPHNTRVPDLATAEPVEHLWRGPSPKPLPNNPTLRTS